MSVDRLAKSEDLLKRLVYTLLLVGVYRLGVYVPTPGIDLGKIKTFLASGASVFQFVNLFSGGALDQFSIFALGIMPYISASIIFQLLTVSFTSLKKLQEEGDQGRRKINQYTRYATVVLAMIQGFGISYGLVNQNMVLPNVTGWSFILTTVISLTAGTCFIMWLGEQITERGIGNGISLLIFSGIIARIPSGLRDAWINRDDFFGVLGFVGLLLFIYGIVTAIVFFETSQRRIPINYAKRVVGNRLMAGQTSHLPLKINMAGVIPPIFASSILLFPATIAGFVPSETLKNIAAIFNLNWLHDFLYVIGIIFFSYFYVSITFNPKDVADNLQKNGGFIPGIRPGKPTSDHLDRLISRLILGGSLYLSVVCVLPQILIGQLNVPSSLAFTFGGTSLLIVVGVAMDTVSQIQSHLLLKNYEGYLGTRTGRFKGKRA